MMGRRRSAALVAAFLAALGLGSLLFGAAPAARKAVLGSSIPQDVAATVRQDDFDNHAWALFVALNSPSEPGKTIGDATRVPRLWETFVDPIDIFQQGGVARALPMARGHGAGHKVFYLSHSGTGLFAAGASGGSEPFEASHNLQAGSNWPLIDQLGNYAIYEIRLNPRMADYITSKGLDTAAGVMAAGDLDLPAGSIVVKAAWRIFPRSWPQEKPEILARYYWTTADIVVSADQDSSKQGGFTIEQVPVGLVGFHAIQKTRRQPQWIWTTFEQADNYEAVGAPPGLAPTYNDGKRAIGDVANNRQPLLPSGSPPPDKHVYLWNRPADMTKAEYTPLAPYTRPQIQRAGNEIPLPAAVNRVWQAALPAPWKHYRLMVAQWTEGGKPGGRPLPRSSDNVSIARNTVLESYLLGDQTLASQVPAVRVRDDGSTFALPDSTLDDMILATITATKYPPDDKTGALTWSSCMLCHEAAQCAVGGKVVLTDFSMLFRSYLKECTSG
jgi:hypothetical protein